MKASSKLILSILGYYLTLIQIVTLVSAEKFSTSGITLRKTSPNVIPNSYIVELNDPPKNLNQSEVFVRSAQTGGINFELREIFNQQVFNGVSIKLNNDNDIGKLKKLEVVKNVWPVAKIQRAEFKIENDNSSSSQNFRSGIGFNALDQPGSNNTEIKVGIIDTGIDYNHPALGGCFKEDGCKVQFGSDFVGDDFNGSNEPKPDDDPLDECVGHGTHIAGIIAGEDLTNNITGIAPNVKLGAYRIFGCEGGTTSELVIKAMGKAFEDGMDIINLSLISDDNAWFGGPESLAAERLTQNGIFVVVPAGNSGDKGIFEISSPSTAPGVITVASIDTEQITSFFIQLSCDPTHRIQYLTPDGGPIQLQGSFSVVPTSNMTNSMDDACETIEENLTGKVALVRRGGCDDTTKISIVQTAGASAIILYNNVNGIAAPELNLADQTGITISIAMISCEDGIFLFKHVQENSSLTIQFPSEGTLINDPSKLKISAFSSFGPTYEMDIKPDIAAPGNNILSIFPVSLGSFKSLSGSSVSAPFITGALAVYMQNKNSTPELTRSVIQNNAKPLIITNSGDSIVAATILKQGTGLINLDDALSSTIVTSPTKLALNDSAHFNGKKRSLTLKNIGKMTTKFTFNHIPAQSIVGYDGVNLVPTDSPITKNSFADVKFSKLSIRLRPGESQDITLSFTPPKENDLNNSLYSGYIAITDSLTKKKSYVSYMGMNGCIETLPIFDDQSGAPFIQSGANKKKFNLPDDVLTVSMKGDDIVLLGMRIAQGTKILTVDVIPDGSAAPAEPVATDTLSQTPPPSETKTNDPPTSTTETPIKTPTETPTETPSPPETPTEAPSPSETPPTETPSPSESQTATTESPTPSETQTQPDDVVIITSTIVTTVTPTIVPTPGAQKRSFIKMYKRRYDMLKPRAFDSSTTQLLVPNSLGTIRGGVLEFQPRNDNSKENQIITLQFDGKVDQPDGTDGVELPNGRYRLFMAALKTFGNPEKQEDWETFTSSIIEIKRE